MSARLSMNPSPRGHRGRRGAADLDLTISQPGHTSNVEGSSNLRSQAANPSQLVSPAPIEVDVIDEEVVFISARAFAQAKKNSRRHRGANTMIDVDSDTSRIGAGNFPKRRRSLSNSASSNYDQIINLESGSQEDIMKKAPEQPNNVPPPPPPATFSCPICFGKLEEEMSTKCGHIFCKRCINAALAVKLVCPTCRKRVKAKDIFRVYLPASE